MIKRKSIVGVFVLILFTVINLYFSTILHGLLGKTFTGINSLSFGGCFDSIINNQKHFILFISIEIFIMLGIALLLVNRFGDYKSNMQTITPKIKTPVMAGQFQHGSSRWLRKNEYKKAFKTVLIDKDNKQIQFLITEGKKDFEDIQEYIKKKNEGEQSVKSN